MPKKHEKKLIDICRRNWLYQSPTLVLEGDKVVRYNLTMFADDYRAMMGIVTTAGGFVMPPEDREALIQQFSDKAKTAAGGYDLSAWSMGELAAALEDTEGINELAPFHEAVNAEMCRRAVG